MDPQTAAPASTPTAAPTPASTDPSAPAPAPAASPEKPKRSPEDVARSVLHERDVRVFRPSTVRFDPRRLQLPDDFFEPTIGELVHAARQDAAAAQRRQDAPLMTKKMRDAETHRRMSRFRKVLIRVLLPDRIALQGIFTPQSTIRHVMRFVRAALLDARNVRFHLFVVPPKMKLLNLDKTLWAEGLCPAALVHVGVDDGPTDTAKLLKPWLLEKIEDTPEAAISIPTIPIEPPKPAPSEEPPKKSKLSKKIPKWFKK